MRTLPITRSVRRSRSAFTLVELMIALTIGGLAITSMYAIGAASTRQFHQQEQIAGVQGALRIAMNQVKRDVARAGYLATPVATAPNTFVPQTCAPDGLGFDAPSTSGSLAGISRFGDDVATGSVTFNNAIDPTGTNRANGFTVDDLVLFGNYETSSEYPGVSVISPTVIAIDQNWHSFQRDFTGWSSGNTGVISAALFGEAFAVGRLIRIQTTRRLRHFAMISSVTIPTVAGQDPTITFAPAIPASCLTDVTGGWVAPVSAIHYFARNAPVGQTERIAGTTGPMAQLLRQEVQPDNKTLPLVTNPGNTRAVLDYLVGFNLAFTMNVATTAGQRDNYAPGTLMSELSDNIATGVASAQSLVTSNPERVRAVSIELAVRAPEQDPALPWTQAGCSNMRCFQVATAVPAGAARVRRLRADVFVPNIAFEGY